MFLTLLSFIIFQGEDDLDNVTGMISHSMTVFILKRMTMYREEKNYKALFYTARSLQFYVRLIRPSLILNQLVKSLICDLAWSSAANGQMYR